LLSIVECCAHTHTHGKLGRERSGKERAGCAYASKLFQYSGEVGRRGIHYVCPIYVEFIFVVVRVGAVRPSVWT
jgi:hypothetical protein